MDDCVFCDIAQGKTRAKIVLETEEFIVFENIEPQAPVHVLVIPKVHYDKKDTISGKNKDFWDKIMETVYATIKHFGLDETGYRLVNNGAGYHGVDHEHVHVIGGTNWRPKDKL